MYLCKSQRHYWNDKVDAALCCNSHQRILTVESGEVLQSTPFCDVVLFRHGWRMTDPTQYDPDYEPPDVGVERTI